MPLIWTFCKSNFDSIMIFRKADFWICFVLNNDFIFIRGAYIFISATGIGSIWPILGAQLLAINIYHIQGVSEMLPKLKTDDSINDTFDDGLESNLILRKKNHLFHSVLLTLFMLHHVSTAQ
ncbi:unnamed protein product [Parnassius mnemosyne]|uniref:Uncharacterized protein n=1 Tax=Parnassius mnemosyne TaxID=213953 RepID=A0AAV1KHB3_9NEOP